MVAWIQRRKPVVINRNKRAKYKEGSLEEGKILTKNNINAIGIESYVTVSCFIKRKCILSFEKIKKCKVEAFCNLLSVWMFLWVSILNI